MQRDHITKLGNIDDMAIVLLDQVFSRATADDTPGIDPRRLGALLHVTSAEVATLAGVHRRSLTRNPWSPEVQRKLALVATILSRAAEMSGSLEKAVVWFRHQPIASFGGLRAADLTAEGRGAHVLLYLDGLENGVYA